MKRNKRRDMHGLANLSQINVQYLGFLLYTCNTQDVANLGQRRKREIPKRNNRAFANEQNKCITTRRLQNMKQKILSTAAMYLCVTFIPKI